MSFYNVGPTTKFSVENDDAYAAQKLDFLLSNFNQPPVNTSLNTSTSATAVTYTAAQVTSAGYIVRASAGVGVTDLLPSAAAIVAALNANQSIRQLSTASVPVVVGAGFNFNLIINNTSSNSITLSTVSLTAGINILKFIVTNAASGSEAVSIAKLN